ncbi:uracil/xanthine transporter [Aciduricibacillus chroicocephali]|uniref:Uracil/xanthine transporter n=1 Tax=Aciduricibacillus chroicocephali TaxID=3054939 RepID=A0ABY9KY80_9BACI|nr:uracil/xanthine transporter [Bacillaceae bacterium 44XB]
MDWTSLKKTSVWAGGVQWLFFIFANIVVIPLTVGQAFHLDHDKIGSLLQLSFIITGIACVAQAWIGHERAIMEGQSGLWWGIILTLVVTTSASGMSLKTLGGSLAVGIFISAALTIVIGLLGIGPYIAKLFNDAVMGVFMLLFGFQLIQIFLKGMLGLPFGKSTDASIDLKTTLFSIVLSALVIIVSIKAPKRFRSYALLVGIIVGWIGYALIFHTKSMSHTSGISVKVFPLGNPKWNTGVIVTAVIAGLLNLANTFGALKGTDDMYGNETTKGQYRRSLTISGLFQGIAGLLGLVPYAPFVSSIGFLQQTKIVDRLPYIIGGFLFFLVGIIPPAGHFFATMPLSVGSAVLFVAYVQLFNSHRSFIKNVSSNSLNVYRVAIPVFVGVVIMTLPSQYFSTMPDFLRPVAANGLLVGIILVLILEHVYNWNQLEDDDQDHEQKAENG